MDASFAEKKNWWLFCGPNISNKEKPKGNSETNEKLRCEKSDKKLSWMEVESNQPSAIILTFFRLYSGAHNGRGDAWAKHCRRLSTRSTRTHLLNWRYTAERPHRTQWAKERERDKKHREYARRTTKSEKRHKTTNRSISKSVCNTETREKKTKMDTQRWCRFIILALIDGCVTHAFPLFIRSFHSRTFFCNAHTHPLADCCIICNNILFFRSECLQFSLLWIYIRRIHSHWLMCKKKTDTMFNTWRLRYHGYELRFSSLALMLINVH